MARFTPFTEAMEMRSAWSLSLVKECREETRIADGTDPQKSQKPR